MRHQEQGSFQPKPLHKFGERFTDQGLEHPVKVKWGKKRGTGYGGEAQRLGKVTYDMIDGPIDPLDVRQ